MTVPKTAGAGMSGVSEAPAEEKVKFFKKLLPSRLREGFSYMCGRAQEKLLTIRRKI